MPTVTPISHPNRVSDAPSMGEYLPFAGRNAIAEMSMAIQFALPFDPQIATAEEAIKEEFLAEFPKFEQVQMFTLNVGGQPFGTSTSNSVPSINGFNLVKTKSDATPARLLRAVANIVSMHFFEYTSWKETKPQGIGYIIRCLKRLAIMQRNPATSVVLRYVDRFTFDGPAEDANAGKLFRPDNRFVPSNLLDRGYQWHSSSGWFEPLVRDTPIYNQLSIASAMIKTAVGISLDHSSIYNLPKQMNSLDELHHGTNMYPALEEIFDRQHNANANLLVNLLNQKMLDTIGLKR